ncbi:MULTISPECIES: MFS transporter [unclassified Microbacterium]|uniref:MFS transporter n=1 Tax=unclassified Microbacterium TaxID=2609290 RepID=UPI000EAAA3A5|nr:MULTISPECIES: MFS transporter [unclassified Microbacterium]MBT2483874.1 MHS family MFS transporter [Microbacterium sp. ISL-108]RKN66855.1 MFS transporter [Microbacterium sp. CGR2]
MSVSTAPPLGHRRAMKAGVAAVVGTTIEWYDFYIYATAAAIVFPQIFFPDIDPGLGTLASFGTYAVAYFMRPLGGIIFGHIGDTLGRKKALTITLFVMGIATVLVGCLPGYDTLGIAAPILLVVLRIAQGLAVGGEWGSASLMAVESAPEKYKTFYGGFTQLGNPLGALMASGAFWILASQGDDVLLSWGWRVPFLFSIVLIGVGMWVRYRVEETPVFEEKVQGQKQSTPLLFALKNNGWPMLLGFCIIAMSSGGYVIATSFVQSYATSPEVGLSAGLILGAMTLASFIEALVTLPLAWLGDKWGAKRVMFTGILLSAVVMVPLVIVIGNQQIALIFLLVSVIRVTLSGAWAPLSTVMAQMFRPQARTTSMSLSYGVGAAVWGGLSPAIATALLLATGNFWSVIAFFGVLAAVALFGTWFAPQHSDLAPVTASFNPRLDTTAVKTRRK